VVETVDGHALALSLAGLRVSVGWCGSAHADLTTEEARTLGYLLRDYARLADATSSPGR
jgi:hypothetical protein